ncbi:glycosyl transferase family 2 [Thermodesulfobacterium geofontis OPF15]|jgi:GT2 family glycosyltransferase|uniref:Glycosyl transferase family 2 n=1 Tax=Thermodesulfobacterium geofontis (strain OPF15) TaxID=795359 RepID=F8C3K0_THEGP|nr:glycosyltransferase family 2 protein [Thermodesulfobacterium geofontis]AEH22449.1 glycosyl transferase family 2 [Thermodesulfobacterium geofontis OPF15]
MKNINVSIVLFKNDKNLVEKAIYSCINSTLINKLYLIDNSSTDALSCLANLDSRIIYIFNNANLGYGKAHNIALRKSIEENIPYHLVLNPDVYFESGVLEELYNFMEANKDVGIVMPKVLYPDGNIQYLCKLLPTPLDLFGRRFLNFGPFKKIIDKRNEIYELRFTGYDKIMEVPYLSGCFMFIRTEVLKKVGLFDERFFMYLEDTDLSRRIHRVAKTVYYPYVHVYHEYGKGSYKNLKLLYYHIKSAIKYFNKYGWFFDKERKEINKRILKKLGWYNP